MPEWYDDPNDDDDNEEQNTRETSPKALRQALKKFQAENAELKTKNTELQTSLRKSSISGFFRDNGINPKLAKYVPSDIEPTEDNLKKWVEDDGDIFNITLKPAGNAAEKPAEGSAGQPGSEGASNSSQGDSGLSIAEQWQAITNAQSGALPPGKEADLLSQITSASDLEALQKVIFSHGGGTEFL